MKPELDVVVDVDELDVADELELELEAELPLDC